MTIKAQLLEDMKTAMKARDAETLTTIRFLMSEIKNAEIDGSSSDDLSVQKIIASQVKKIKDAINDFQQANRLDLVTQEEKKIAVMSKYLPAQLDDATLTQIIKDVIAQTADHQNQGKIIGQVVKAVAGQADGQRIKVLVSQLLAQ